MTNVGGIANFDYIDFVSNHKLQENLAGYEDLDAPQDVQNQVSNMARARMGEDPDLIAGARDVTDSALQYDGWNYVGEDGDGCVLYEKEGLTIKVKIFEA